MGPQEFGGSNVEKNQKKEKKLFENTMNNNTENTDL